MTEIASNVMIEPLFYDALSGEFTPTVDPQQRVHTLARLAMGTVTKGVLNVDDRAFHLVNFLYAPSWAPDVTCNVRAGGPNFVSPADVVIRGIHLKNARHHSLSITQFAKSTLQIDTETYNPQIYAYSLGEELLTARSAVAKAAEEFFAK